MPKPTTLLDLQTGQKEHDLKYHQDVFHLQPWERMTHYSQHYSKYLWRIKTAPQSELQEALGRNYVDAFIITLAASDILNINLDDRMLEGFGRQASDGILGYVGPIGKGQRMDLEYLRQWTKDRFIDSNGKIAKALESHLHMEHLNGKEMQIDGVVGMTQALLIGSAHMNFDLEGRTRERWKEVERKRIL